MKRLLLAPTLIFMLVLTQQVRADSSGAAQAPPPASDDMAMPLSYALAAAETPKEEVYITVGADQIELPTGATPPNSGDTVTNTVLAYGRIVVPFDDIEAIAPPTRVVLNTTPPAPNPYDGMPPSNAFKLLIASLSHAQWTDLIGKAGISYQDLTTDDQRALFGAMFPVTPLQTYIRQTFVHGNPPDQRLPVIQADALKTARLRLGKRYTISVPFVGKHLFLQADDGPDATPVYDLQPAYSQSQSAMYGVALRAVVPNTLKDSDLDYDSAVLKTRVELGGVKTVGDIINQIGMATHQEIYADPHFEGRSVSVFGSAPARADNLLKALAVCVAGSYRKVGSAYVLTDDVVGIGVRKSIIDSFIIQADVSRQELLDHAGDYLFTVRHGMDDLAFLPGVTDLSAAENALILQQRAQPSFVPGEGVDIQPKLSELTPAQQDVATTFKDGWEKAEGLKNPTGDQLTLDEKISIATRPELDMDVAGVDRVIDLSNYLDIYDLFQPSSGLRNKIADKQTANLPSSSGVPPKSPSATPQLVSHQLRLIASRALLASPQTASEVDSIVASMKVVGLNQLWLNVFSGGESHLTVPANSKDNNILTEALAKTKGTGITVIPTIDLLKWSPKAPADIQDLTMMGENSAVAQTAKNRYDYAMHYMDVSGDPEVALKSDDTYVSPAAEGVRNQLVALVKTIASTPGVGSIALRETLSNGYDQDPDGRYSINEYKLGYTVPMRLAFLRESHEDPIDLDPEAVIAEVVPDTSLPNYDDRLITGNVKNEWNIFRSDTDRALLALLWQTAQGASKSRPMPIWIHDRAKDFGTTWFGLWIDPKTPLPAVPADFIFVGYSPGMDVAAVAHSTCPTNVMVLKGSSLSAPDLFSQALNNVKSGWSGFIVDASGQPAGDPLAALAKALTQHKTPTQAAGSPLAALPR